jgi:hypothetical protein
MDEHKDEMVCPSCEVLKQQLEIANHQNKQLMDRLLAPPPAEVNEPPIAISAPRNVPWGVRKQMLESEDRERARLMNQAPVPIADLEKELDIAAKVREQQ